MMELKLDTNALSSLIEADPTFKISIQQAVLQNIANRYVKGAGSELDRMVSNIKQELLDQYSKQNSWGGVRTLNPSLKAELKKSLDTEISGMIKTSLDSIGPLVNATIKDAFADIDKTKIDRELDKLMDRYTTEYIQNKLTTRWNETLKLLAQ